jgi:thiol:disulfide interchange protein
MSGSAKDLPARGEPMNNYEKIAAVVLRCLACYILMFAVIEWGIVAAGALLINFGLFPRSSIATEARMLVSVFYLIAGLALYTRSKPLAHRIAEAFQDD